jgi:membrane protease YdiL (CAAX protease family)
MTAARDGVRWRPIALFLLLAFGISWTVWLAMDRLDLPWWTGIAASWGPGVAALLLRGPLLREGFRNSGLLTLGRGSGVRPAYAVALTLIAAAAVASTAVGISAGAFQLDWSPDRALGSANLIVAFIAGHFGLWGLLLSFVVVPLVPASELGEELGWRDYLLPRLLPLGGSWAYLLSGAIWAAWHLPYNVVLGHNKGLAGFPLFALYIVLFGALQAHLRLRSGSVWPCAFLHAAVGYQPWVVLALTQVRPGFSPAGPEQSMAIVEYGLTMLAGVVALVLAARSDRGGGDASRSASGP